jgi:ribonuclease Z
MDIKYSTENNGETYMKINVDTQIYTIRGYSRAGLRTSILIDEINVVFDMGYANDRAYSFDNKLISHGHTDHIGALHTDYCARQLYNINKPNLIIMPNQCIKPFTMIASAISEMNCGKLGSNIKIFDSIKNTIMIESELCETEYVKLINNGRSELYVKSFIMDHKIKSYGYIIYRKSRKLKPEYIGLKSSDIISLKKTIGEQNITYEIFTPLVGYTGDTSISGVINHNEFLTVPLLIMECTGFSENDYSDCCSGKHIHVNDLTLYHHLFENNKIVLFHFSQQYKHIDQILEYCNSIPESFKNKLLFFF